MHKLFFINLLKRWFRISFLLIFLCFICQFLALFCFLLKINQKSIGMYCSFLYFCIRKQKKISLLHSDRIRAKYKDVVIQCCASGGGRANWGTSYFFPAIAMASHISAVPNHTVFRTTSLKYRIDVAMSGRLGMEIQPKNMTDEEKALCKKAFLSIRKFGYVFLPIWI